MTDDFAGVVRTRARVRLISGVEGEVTEVIEGRRANKSGATSTAAYEVRLDDGTTKRISHGEIAAVVKDPDS